MGLTREQIDRRRIKDSRKRSEYNARMAPIWAEEARKESERLTALGMLLGAEWSDWKECFVKTERSDAGRWVTSRYFDRQGQEIEDPKPHYELYKPATTHDTFSNNDMIDTMRYVWGKK